MGDKKEIEIVRHTMMNYLEIFLVEMTSRSPHSHDDMEIGLLLEGRLRLFTGSDCHELGAGDIYILNRNQVHSLLGCESQCRILAFQIHTDFYRRIDYELSFLKFDDHVVPMGRFHEILHRQLLDCAACYFSAAPHSGLKCSGILLDALHGLLTHMPYTLASEKENVAAADSALRLSRITAYISDHYREHISLQEVADLENISPYHASHFIKKTLGISFQEYMNNLRFEHALRLMENSALNLLDICLETGFSSSRYLNQMFMKNYGCSARAYMKLPEKPRFAQTPLPANTVQNRYAFERAGRILRGYVGTSQ